MYIRPYEFILSTFLCALMFCILPSRTHVNVSGCHRLGDWADSGLEALEAILICSEECMTKMAIFDSRDIREKRRLGNLNGRH
jgi:hypothetical protein